MLRAENERTNSCSILNWRDKILLFGNTLTLLQNHANVLFASVNEIKNNCWKIEKNISDKGKTGV